MREWISVKDRLPETTAKVWVWGKPGTPFDWFVGGNGYHAWCVYDSNGERVWRSEGGYPVRGRVTHWMPLPEPPNA